jgi:hypothetical protein
MTNRSRLASLLAAFAVVAFALPVQAANPKAATKAKPATDAALVQALQAVSPDALGGRLGLDLAASKKTDVAVERRGQPAPTAAATTASVRGVEMPTKPAPSKS